MSLSVFPWIAVNIGRTQLGNAAGFGDDPFLSFEEARLSVRLAPLLFQQTVTIGTASLDSFSLNLEVAADGSNNWSDFAEAGEAAPAEETTDAGGAQALDIAEVKLSNASVSFRDAQAGTSNTITGLSLTTSSVAAGDPFDIQAEFEFSAEPAGISGRLEFSSTMTFSEGNEQMSLRDFQINGHFDIAVIAAFKEFSRYRIHSELAIRAVHTQDHVLEGHSREIGFFESRGPVRVERSDQVNWNFDITFCRRCAAGVRIRRRHIAVDVDAVRRQIELKCAVRRQWHADLTGQCRVIESNRHRCQSKRCLSNGSISAERHSCKCIGIRSGQRLDTDRLHEFF